MEAIERKEIRERLKESRLKVKYETLGSEGKENP